MRALPSAAHLSRAHAHGLPQVKKLIELAQRPVTIDFSMAEEVSFPAAPPRGARATEAGGVPAYVRRPV